MRGQRQRFVLVALAALAAVWLLVFAGYRVADHFKMTAEKVQAYAASVDLSKLSPADRLKAIRALAAKLNALTPEERRRARLDRVGMKWFEEMTEEEKGIFIEETMPTGFKQMLTAFEEMPEARRQRAVDDALKRLRETRANMAAGEMPQGGPPGSTNQPPPLSPELEAKIKTIGLKAFYSDSSAQTKAELAPVLEELQRTMELGRRYRRN